MIWITLLLSVAIGAGAAWIVPTDSKTFKYLLSFSGAFLFATLLTHMLPEIFEHGNWNMGPTVNPQPFPGRTRFRRHFPGGRFRELLARSFQGNFGNLYFVGYQALKKCSGPGAKPMGVQYRDRVSKLCSLQSSQNMIL